MQLLKDFFKMILFTVIVLSAPVLIFVTINFTSGIMYNILKEMPKERLEIINKCSNFVGSCIITAVPVTLGLLYAKWKNSRKEIIRRADENNTFITARLVQKMEIEYSHNDANNDKYSRGWDYEGIYEYTLNGETKNKRILFMRLPDDEIRLYLKNKNGSKVFSNTEYENKTWFVIPLIALATIVTLIWVVGMMSMISSLI